MVPIGPASTKCRRWRENDLPPRPLNRSHRSSSIFELVSCGVVEMIKLFAILGINEQTQGRLQAMKEEGFPGRYWADQEEKKDKEIKRLSEGFPQGMNTPFVENLPHWHNPRCPGCVAFVERYLAMKKEDNVLQNMSEE